MYKPTFRECITINIYMLHAQRQRDIIKACKQ